MKVLTLLTLLLTILLPDHAIAEHADLVVLQSSVLQPYEEVRQGFLREWSKLPSRHGFKKIDKGNIREFVLSQEERRTLPARISKLDPHIIIAIGTNALNMAARLPDVPIIYLLVPYPETVISERKNLTGIKMTIPATRQLKELTGILPKIKRIGVIYDQQRSSRLVEEARDYARKSNLVMKTKTVTKSHQVPVKLVEFQGEIDCFWMIPDLTVTTPQTVEAILLYSLENRVPVLTFSEKYLRMGATISITYDLQKMGRQTAILAARILDGDNTALDTVHEVENTRISINSTVAEKLGISASGKKQSPAKE